jgi:hypothetical protein
MTRGGAGYEKYFRDAAAQFEKLNPTIQIKIEPQDQDYKDKLKVEMAGGTAPDMVFSADDSMFSFAARDTLLDLTKYCRRAVSRIATTGPPRSIRRVLVRTSMPCPSITACGCCSITRRCSTALTCATPI